VCVSVCLSGCLFVWPALFFTLLTFPFWPGRAPFDVGLSDIKAHN